MEKDGRIKAQKNFTLLYTFRVMSSFKLYTPLHFLNQDLQDVEDGQDRLYTPLHISRNALLQTLHCFTLFGPGFTGWKRMGG